MSLPLPWVEKIFQKLTLTYGRDFLGRWEGVPLEEVKADWAHELAGYQQSPGPISYALQNLPPKPPTVLEFRAICQRAPAGPSEVARIEHSDRTDEGGERGKQLARDLLARIRRQSA